MRTIFGKIDESALVVADVTLVGNVHTSRADGSTAAGKKLINSNVAIELGYALSALTDRNVLLVFNEHYGKHEDLPFDLRHKGGAIVFNLAPEADKGLIENQKKKLKDWFVSSLKPYVRKSQVSPGPFQETPSTFSKAAYFQKGEILARAGTRGFDEINFSYDTESLCYLRLIPISRLATLLSLATLKDVAQHAPTLASGHGVVLADHNEHGAIGYEPVSNPHSGPAGLDASTQLFQNGEIWSIGAALIRTDLAGNHQGQCFRFFPRALSSDSTMTSYAP